MALAWKVTVAVFSGFSVVKVVSSVVVAPALSVAVAVTVYFLPYARSLGRTPGPVVLQRAVDLRLAGGDGDRLERAVRGADDDRLDR